MSGEGGMGSGEIFHFPFYIFHLSLAELRGAYNGICYCQNCAASEQCQMKNGIWNMESPQNFSLLLKQGECPTPRTLNTKSLSSVPAAPLPRSASSRSAPAPSAAKCVRPDARHKSDRRLSWRESSLPRVRLRVRPHVLRSISRAGPSGSARRSVPATLRQAN